MPDTTNNEGYLVQLRSPEGDNVYPIISAEMIKDANGNTYDLSEIATKAEIQELDNMIIRNMLGIVTPIVRAKIRIGGFDYLVVHMDTDIVYAILETWVQNTPYGGISGSAAYSGSIVANLCTTWYNSYVPIELKTAGTFVNVEIEGVTSPCFIPTYDQINSGWDYFNSAETRIFYDAANTAHEWWTSSTYSSSAMYYVNKSGDHKNGLGLGSMLGFRPCLAINRAVFSV